MPTKWFNVFAGCETGLLKGIHADEGSWENLTDLKEAGRDQQIVDCCWFDSGQTQLLLGRKNNVLERRECDTGALVHTHQYPTDSGKLKSVGFTDVGMITATDIGCVQLWDEDHEEVCAIDAGPNLHRMRQKPGSPNTILTGGKESPVRLWDLNDPQTPVFTAKNVRNDWLNLRVPMWVTDAQFMKGSSQIATCTAHHQVRVYDPSTSQRRPVVEIVYGENPFTSLAVCSDNKQVVVGDAHGALALLDLRKRALVHVYRGAAGSVRSLHVHPRLPLLVSTGLDRYVRVHQLHSRQMLHKVYVKSAVNCLALRDSWLRPYGKKVVDEVLPEAEVIEDVKEEELSDVADDDELWQQMEVVGSKRPLADSPAAKPNNKSKRSKRTKQPSTSQDTVTKRKAKLESSSTEKHSEGTTPSKPKKKSKKTKEKSLSS